LEFTDLTEGDGSGFEAVGLLESGGDGGRLTGHLLGHQLLAGHFLGSRLAGSLLCSGHQNIIPLLHPPTLTAGFSFKILMLPPKYNPQFSKINFMICTIFPFPTRSKAE
jgi:hypothetical protein